MAAPAEANVHEHMARTMYYLSIHLLIASVVAAAAWALTSTLRASATTKYWIWVATAFNFVLPSGALIDKLWGPHFSWARPIGAIGGPVWDMTEGRPAVILAVLWLTGAFFMLARLISRIRREHRESQELPPANASVAPDFLADGVPVTFGDKSSGPAVRGVLSPRILLPFGINQQLNSRELWFHPFMWLAGARLGLYRELSCDEAVIRRAHGQELVSALAKLAIPQQAGVLQASASSHLSDRLSLLACPPQTTHRAANLLLTSLFFAIVAAGVFQTIAHTACCFATKH
jgi:hypothetical protein